MKHQNSKLISSLSSTYENLNCDEIPKTRKQILNPLIDFIQAKVDTKQAIHLNFICTHNSRRSQFAQIWAQVAAYYFEIQVSNYSGGVEITAFHPNAIASLRNVGFKISKSGTNNPIYTVKYSENDLPLKMFSKLYDDKSNPLNSFAAIMTCSHADENCPLIFGAEKRISINYEDPKEFDGTDLESTIYNERCIQIATEMKYVFSQIKKD